MNILLALLLLLLLAQRQLTARPIKSNLFLLPILALAYGVYLASQEGAGTGETISLFIGAGLGAAAGLVQGRFTRVEEHQGVWFAVGSFWGLAVWLLSIPIRFLVRYGVVELFHITPSLTGSYAFVPYLFSIAGLLLGRAAYLAIRYPHAVTGAMQTSRRERRAARRSHGR